MTTYPAQIDTTSTLPTAIDNVSPIKGDLFNSVRDAVLAIESELGVQPSGTNSTVKARLNSLDSTINNIQVIDLSQDLGGTLSNPKVIGLQGHPISSALPTFSDVLTWSGIAWEPLSPKLSTLVIDSDLNLDGYKIINLADPTTTQGAATKNYVDTLITLVIKKDGSVAFTGNQSFGNHKINNLLDPTAPQDGATKNYVDGYVVNATILGGDLSGTTGAANVIKLRGNALKSGINGPSQDGYALVWKNSASDYEPLPISKSLNLINTGTLTSSNGDLSIINGNMSIGGGATPTITFVCNGIDDATIVSNNGLTLSGTSVIINTEATINGTLGVSGDSTFNGNVAIPSGVELNVLDGASFSIGLNSGIAVFSPITFQGQGRITYKHAAGPDADTTVVNGNFDIMIISTTTSNRSYTIDDTTNTREVGDRLIFLNRSSNVISIKNPSNLSFVSISNQQAAIVYYDGSNWLVEQKYALI